jgi:hypothetical protein
MSEKLRGPNHAAIKNGKENKQLRDRELKQLRLSTSARISQSVAPLTAREAGRSFKLSISNRLTIPTPS